MRIKITSDSTCDLNQDYLEEKNVETLPLYIIKDGVDYKDGIEITPLEIFSHVDNGGEITSTSAVSVSDYETAFGRLSKEYDAVIHINLSSGLSCCNQNANIAGSEFDNVYVIDSKLATSATGYLVTKAVELAESGMEAEEIVANIEELKDRMEISFLIDRLDYMKKGGRCSSAVAMGAKLLQIKPCIEMKDGNLVPVKKFKGAMSKAFKKYMTERFSDRTDIDTSLLFLSHTNADEELVEQAREYAESLGIFEKIVITKVGCTISSHVGKNTIGYVFARKK